MPVASTRNPSRHIVFSGGGSGGHLTPSIAVAEALFHRDPDAQVTFLTSGRRVDQVVLKNSFVADDERCSIVALSVTQPPGLTFSGASHAWALADSVLRCRRQFRSISTHVVLATGGFASLPGLLAAKQCRIPTVLFEANTRPGKINQWWKPLATARFSAWPVADVPRLADFVYVGMPVRSWTAEAKEKQLSSEISGIRRILIVGGSQGSRRLNDIVHAALPLVKLPDDWQILHQTGTDKRSFISTQCSRHNMTTKSYIDHLPDALRQSAFVISRSGAVTLGEIAATGCPSILIPLSTAALSHQNSNAEFLRNQGAAIIVNETGAHPEIDLANAIHTLVNDTSSRQTMSQAAQLLHRPDAASDIARSLLELADRSQHNN
ncbi:MAG: UDP-N-acetylglucosamine--N-acetylmuramyl-(pentapeptide) pyrophosphoryl-undecaprenol N-acetylglucosamine transferase [Fuerstiella sp.]|nr:UDP-N-acetylglucosamine--N-acetylmuramyl-(pentapeptide) pyrophosphoryl-undecaprenol N-acetylglucosamine transferase [Fuerstiella sp.]